MKKTVVSPGSATIINAISTGFGSAFGIDLNIKASVSENNTGEIISKSDIGADTKLMDMCASAVIDYYDVDCSLTIGTETNLPMGSGLSSSSALSNAVCKAVSSFIAEEFELKPLDDYELLNLAIDTSLDAKVTITGAYDDASASYFGGVVVSDNYNRKLLVKEKFKESDILIFLVDKNSLTIDVDVERISLISSMVDLAYKQALKKNYFKALNLNGILYSSVLGYDSNIAIEALSAGALASGLSGTGSAFTAIVDDVSIDSVKEAWSQFEGEIIQTKVNNQGTILL
ncbi:shikimate kinase [uncultured Methanobrevibacter sp.]|uniref:shikimate kinase n=1 Tax=uncultured Methanobrevibacter sp. TaxID=253161 RepID=UPI0025D1D04A|nr:shikimate kinase [uncultured Methanobrevibacter sp.]